MNTIIKIKKFILFMICIYSFCLIFSFTDRTKKVDYDTSRENIISYNEKVRAVFEKFGYEVLSSETTQTDEMFLTETIYHVDKNDGNVYIDICYSRGTESFSIDYSSHINEYGPGNSGINDKLVVEILDIISGYDFSKKYIPGLIDNALEKNIVNAKERYNFRIYDNKIIDFWMNWYVSYFIYDDNSIVNGIPRAKYNVQLSITGLTKTGTR